MDTLQASLAPADHSINNSNVNVAKLSPGLNRQEQKTRIAFLQNEQAELETEIRYNTCLPSFKSNRSVKNGENTCKKS